MAFYLDIFYRRYYKKLENTAHQEFNKSEYKDFNYIRSMIYSGKDFIKPNARYSPQAIDDIFPKYLLDNIHIYDKFILPVEAEESPLL
ncbi:hypothetical protein [methane-oxidizing endosymbiont of Gigantopelta aegis]|uniref:hypothetical protein n=1 Tax=methane-oxidizing endosymbiont of Gigantopelta aegis TaxID=2794938 RepID=UPI001FDAA8EA|nr:hypothetical protein [methane-oxidizing endosymbiont of Gigantopelta aegis]